MASILAESYNFEERMEIDNGSKSDLEEGEVSDPAEFPSRVYENDEKHVFETGIDIFSPQVQEKLEERAKRFNIDPKTTTALTDEQIQELYSSLGVTDQNDRNIRFDAIHIRGTEEMSTDDVFQYFNVYGPATIEWINDCSCNVVWLDRSSAARAMKGMSRAIKGLSQREKLSKASESGVDIVMEDEINEDQNCVDDNSADISTIDTPVPPGYWRLGLPSPKAKHILLRYATNKDKKQSKAEKMSRYYKKYGNPNYGGMVGIITDRKRKTFYSNDDDETDSVDLESGKKNPWGNLSKMWAMSENTDEQRPRSHQPRISKSLKDRIGFKRELPKQQYSASEHSDSDNIDDLRKRIKQPRMKMYADEEELRVQRSRRRRDDQSYVNTKQNYIKKEYSTDEEEQEIVIPVAVKKPDIKSRLGDYVRSDDYHNGQLDSGDFDRDDIYTGAYGSVVNIIRSQSHTKPSLASAVTRTNIETRRNNTSESSEGSDNDEDSRGSTRRKSFSRPGFDKADLRSRLSNKSSMYKNKSEALKVEDEYYSD